MINTREVDEVRISAFVYRRNISLARIASYTSFAWHVAQLPAVLGADVIYVCVPDYLSAFAVLSVARPPQCVIIDVVDLWPEALPVKGALKWGVKRVLRYGLSSFRAAQLAKASHVFFQSEYFMSVVGEINVPTSLLLMASTGTAVMSKCATKAQIHRCLRVLILGSINNITDVDSLVSIVGMISKCRDVVVVIIGGGESVARLRSSLRIPRVVVEDYGITFDAEVKRRAIESAHFGYNGYVEATEVAVSYKSVEYFQNGLPVLNSAKGDTQRFIEQYKCGFNFSKESLAILVTKILALSESEYTSLVTGCYKLFNERFSYREFAAEIHCRLRALMTDRGINV